MLTPSMRAHLKSIRREMSADQPTDAAAVDIWQRTRSLVEVLLTVMEQTINPKAGTKTEAKERWDQLFGTKESAVVTLQKLVKLLMELEVYAGGSVAATVAPDPQELALLNQWLEETSGLRGGQEGAPMEPA